MPGAAEAQQGGGSPRRLAAIAAGCLVVAVFAIGYGAFATVSANAATQALEGEMQETLVAKGAVDAGQVISPDMVEVKRIPARYRSQSALGAEGLQGQDAVIGKRTLVGLAAGSQIGANDVAGQVGGGFLAGSLGQGMVAVSLVVDAESGVAGRLCLADHVTVVAAGGSSPNAATVQLLCRDVRVISLDADAAGASSGYSTVTVEVTPEQAEEICAARSAGEVSVILQAAADARLQG